MVEPINDSMRPSLCINDGIGDIKFVRVIDGDYPKSDSAVVGNIKEILKVCRLSISNGLNY